MFKLFFLNKMLVEPLIAYYIKRLNLMYINYFFSFKKCYKRCS